MERVAVNGDMVRSGKIALKLLMGDAKDAWIDPASIKEDGAWYARVFTIYQGEIEDITAYFGILSDAFYMENVISLWQITDGQLREAVQKVSMALYGRNHAITYSML